MAVLKVAIILISLCAFSVTAQTVADAPADVTLADCVAAAQATSPNVRIASVALDTASALLLQARARNGLNLGESVAYFHQGTIPGTNNAISTSTSTTAASTPAATTASVAGGGGANGENLQGTLALTGPATSIGLTAQHSIDEGSPVNQISGISLSGSQILYDGYAGGRASGAVEQAQTAYQASKDSYDAALKSAVYLVKQAYYTLLGDQESVGLRQATVQQALENQSLYHGLFAAERTTKLSVLQIDVALTQAQLDVKTAQYTVTTDRKKLSLAIGWPLEKNYTVVQSPLPDIAALALQDALASAAQNRSELLILDQNIAASGIALSLQKSQFAPVVSLTGSAGVGQNWTSNNTEGAFTVGLSVALPPIYDGELQHSLLKQWDDQIASYQVQLDQEKQSIAIDVQNALFLAADTRERQALAIRNLEQAQGQYDLEKAKLSVGSGTTLDVLTAFAILATARVGIEQAKTTYLLAVLNLYSVMGL